MIADFVRNGLAEIKICKKNIKLSVHLSGADSIPFFIHTNISVIPFLINNGSTQVIKYVFINLTISKKEPDNNFVENADV